MLRKSEFGLVFLGSALAAVLAVCLPTLRAMALTTPSTFVVKTTVAASCALATSPMDFGAYAGDQLDATSTVTVTCTSGTSFQIGLNDGTGVGRSFTTRAMTGPGGATLHYGLYQNSGRNSFWGNTGGVDTPPASTGTGSAVALTVFGRIAANQHPAVGSYRDTITATVFY